MGPYWARTAWPDPKNATAMAASTKVLVRMEVSPEVHNARRKGSTATDSKSRFFGTIGKVFADFPDCVEVL
jgi:hypothetical protein